MILKKITTLRLKTEEPFNFKFTVWKPSHFPSPLEIFDAEKDICYRTFLLGQKPLGLRLTDFNGEGIKVDIYSNSFIAKKERDELTKRLRWSYGLDEDLTEFYRIARKDPLLIEPLKDMKGMRNSCLHTLFEILCISLVLQNTNVKRSQAMLKSLLENYGRKVEFDGQDMYVFFSSIRINKTTEDELRKDCRLGYRAKYLKTIAEAFTESDIEKKVREMNYEEAKNELMKIKGIGPYSASIALVEYLRFPQLMTLDLWSRKVFSKLFFGHENVDYDKIQKEASKRWNGYKGLAALYIMEDLYFRGKVDSKGNLE